MKTLWGRAAATVSILAVTGSLIVGTPAQAADPVVLNLLGINDFHGRIDNNTVKFAGTVEQLRAEAGDARTLMVSAGDNVGASLFPSASAGDIPTLDVLNALELDASAAGNHEFDKGYSDLTDRIAPAADFPILGANVFKAGGERALEPYEIVAVDGLDVAVVGAVTEETPSLVNPDGVAGLTFADPAASINDAVAELNALADPPDVIVASYHEGAPDGTQTYEQAIASSAVFKDLAENTSAQVDAIFMGHTHQAYAYNAPVPGQPGQTRPIVQTGQYGGNIGQIQLTVDPDTGEVQSHTQRNVARTTAADDGLISTYPRVAQVDAIVDAALAKAAEVGNQVKGHLTADITRAFNGTAEDRAGESTLGGLVADALLAKVSETPAGADLAMTNPGGLRADLLFAGSGGTNTDGVITYAEANSVLPFVNNLSSVTLTGASLKKVLEQQWQRNADGTVPSRSYLQMGVSENVKYTFDPTRPEGDRITGVTIDGQELDPAGSYKIAVPSFLAAGGDNFRAFREGSSVDTGLVDYEAWIEYLQQNDPVSPDFARRSLDVEGLKTSYVSGREVSFTLPKLDLTSLGSPDNTSVKATLHLAGDDVDLGSFPVNDGAATVRFDLPADQVGTATVEVEAAPTGTRATLPAFEVVEPTPTATTASVEEKHPSAREPFDVDVSVGGGDVTPTGSVTVLVGDRVLGEGELADGSATVVVPDGALRPGRHQLTVRYGGDETHAPSSDSLTVVVTSSAG
ncbi:5'-nucleotidase C-terminal domain-containing protein [Aeromicrobium sp.]|uniref:5'-nucleotidase C-terminal domain-containing protein n=1 Tax=Aeromicrobium sp. TaxID=1871063 RepID=UPI003D6BDC44